MEINNKRSYCAEYARATFNPPAKLRKWRK